MSNLNYSKLLLKARNSTRAPLLAKICISMCTTFFIVFQAFSQQFPPGFNQKSIAKNLYSPTAMAIAPDGRIFVAEQGGVLRVIKDEELLAKPFMEIEPDADGNKSIVGITFDLNFNSNHFIYLYYIVISTKHSRVSRFKASGNVVKEGSEEVILEIEDDNVDINHNGGYMQFGPDGKLYIATGDLYKSENAQNLNNYHGKLLRINADGSIPSGNPFSDPEDSEEKKRIWAYGLRNAFTFDIHPKTGKIYVNDVGLVDYEEINDATAGGRNFGWPAEEGPAENPAYTSPVYSYKRVLEPGNEHGCAITGGVFFNPASTNYPAAYKNKYFFQEYCNGWIAMLDLEGNVKKEPFVTGLDNNSMYLSVGPDGNLYYLSRKSKKSTLHKITYTQSEAPEITSQPEDISVSEGKSATFSISASGTGPLKYQWQKGGKDISEATSATFTVSKVTAQHAGEYRVIIKNGAGAVTSKPATLTVTIFNDAPVAVIETPASGSLYRAGQSISFEGTATDEEDGELPENAFSWDIVFHHNTHTHEMPVISNGKRKGTFVIPNTGETETNVWYRLYLTVTDSDGAKHKVYRDIHPRTSTVSFTTEPAGLKIMLDGKSIPTPRSVKGVEGLLRTISTEFTQTRDGKKYQFDRWAHGGSRHQNIGFPQGDASYKAIFKLVDTDSDTDTDLREPENPDGAVRGLDYAYYEGVWNSLPDFDALTPEKKGALNTFNLSAANRTKNFGFRFTGYIHVPVNGEYTFYTLSDDGSKLYIGNTLVVSNNGVHPKRERTGSIGLKAGKHAITVVYFEKEGSQVLEVFWKGPNLNKQAIPSTALYKVGANGNTADSHSANARLAAPDYKATVGVKVYPNPASDIIHVDFTSEHSEEVEVIVTDIFSRRVYTGRQAVQPGENKFSLQTQGLKSGTYLLQVQAGTGKYSQRITVFK